MDIADIYQWLVDKHRAGKFDYDKSHLEKIKEVSKNRLDKERIKQGDENKEYLMLYYTKVGFKRNLLEAYHLSLMYSENILSSDNAVYVKSNFYKWYLAFKSLLDKEEFGIEEAIKGIELTYLCINKDMQHFNACRSELIRQMGDFLDEVYPNIQDDDIDADSLDLHKKASSNMWLNLELLKNRTELEWVFPDDFSLSDDFFDMFETIKWINEKLNSNERKAGNTKTDQVPQELVESFVKEHVFESSDEKFIHKNGANKGLPNWSQLAKLYKENDPEFYIHRNDEILQIMSDRQLRERLKEAYNTLKYRWK